MNTYQLLIIELSGEIAKLEAKKAPLIAKKEAAEAAYAKRVEQEINNSDDPALTKALFKTDPSFMEGFLARKDHNDTTLSDQMLLAMSCSDQIEALDLKIAAYQEERINLVELVYELMVAYDQPRLNEILCLHELHDKRLEEREERLVTSGMIRQLAPTTDQN